MNNELPQSSHKYHDGKYAITSFEKGDREFRRASCTVEGICILPFDTNENGSISNLYLSKYTDFMDGSDGYTCMSFDSNDQRSSDFEELSSLINRELSIDTDVDDLYYLGEIKMPIPFSRSYRCYGLNLDKFIKKFDGFSAETPKDSPYDIQKVKASRVMRGEFQDSLVLSSCMLLLSYLD